METPEFNDDQAAELWQRLKGAAGRSEGEPVDANLLAAYVDGRLDDAGTEQVEAALMADPDLLDAVVDLDGADHVGAAAPPGFVLAVQAALPPGQVARSDTAFASLWKWAAAAAVLVAVSFAGFHLGRQSNVQTQAAVSDEVVIESLRQEYSGNIFALEAMTVMEEER